MRRKSAFDNYEYDENPTETGLALSILLPVHIRQTIPVPLLKRGWTITYEDEAIVFVSTFSQGIERKQPLR